MIGIVCAIPQELEGFKESLESARAHTQWAWSIYQGYMGGASTVLVMSGVGKVNAALATYLLKDKFSADLIISAGIGGIIDRELVLGDIVVGRDTCYHDCFVPLSGSNLSADDLPSMSHVFSFQPLLVACVVETLRDHLPELPPVLSKKTSRVFPRVKVGRIVSGDIPVTTADMANNLQNGFGATCVDMETAGVAQACMLQALPFIALRIMSDYADQYAYLNMMRYSQDLGCYLGQVIAQLMPSLPQAEEQTNLSLRV